jgi:hypothetical protein
VRDDEAAYRPWVGGEAMDTAHSSQIVAVRLGWCFARCCCEGAETTTSPRAGNDYPMAGRARTEIRPELHDP